MLPQPSNLMAPLSKTCLLGSHILSLSENPTHLPRPWQPERLTPMSAAAFMAVWTSLTSCPIALIPTGLEMGTFCPGKTDVVMLSHLPFHILLTPSKASDLNMHPRPIHRPLHLFGSFHLKHSAECTGSDYAALVGLTSGHAPQIRTHNKDILLG